MTRRWLLARLPLRRQTVLRALVWRASPACGGWTGLTVDDHRTGRATSFPLLAAPLGESSLVVLPRHRDRMSWWRHLGRGTGVTVLDCGTWREARARLVTPGSMEFSVARSAYLARWPRARVGAGPLVVLDLRAPTRGS
jgi:hypothetical protein